MHNTFFSALLFAHAPINYNNELYFCYKQKVSEISIKFINMLTCFLYVIFVKLSNSSGLINNIIYITIKKDNSVNRMIIAKIIYFLLIISLSHAISEVANFPVITDMKSGEHKLTLKTLAGPNSTSLNQAYRSSSFEVVFTEKPYVAIGLLVFEAQSSNNNVDYDVRITSIQKAFFISSVQIRSGTILNELRYMYIAFPKSKAYGEIYFIAYQNLTDFTGTINTQIETIQNYASSYDLSHTNIFRPILASFNIQATNNDYSVHVEAYQHSENQFKTTLQSNSTLKAVNFFVIYIDKSVLEESNQFFFDYGYAYAENSQSGISVLDIPISSFNYYNYIQGANWLALKSNQTVLSINFNGNGVPVSTLGTFKYARSNTFHWRRRDCTTLTYYLHVQAKCYQDCPIRYANNDTLNFCQSCHYSCLNCLSDGNTCTQCSTSNSTNELQNVNRDLSNGSCSCLDSFFDSGVQKCSECHYTCQTCINQNINCLTCDNTRQLVNNSCSCQTRKYDTESNSSICENCHYTCLSCSGSNNFCTSCNLNANRQLTSNNKCLCSSGFSASVGVEACTQDSQLVCITSCKTCENTSSTCTSCHLGVNRVLTSKACPCKSGYQSLSSALQCTEICGDGKIFEDQCDDGNAISGDGCSGICKVEANYSCDVTVQPTRCIYQLGYNISVSFILKDKTSNKIQLKFFIQPAPPQGTVPTITIITSSSTQTSSSNSNKLSIRVANLATVTYLFEGTALSMTLQYSQAIPEFTYARLSLGQQIGTSDQFQVVSGDGLAFNYYDQYTYTLYYSQIIMIWVLIGLIWSLAIIFIIIDKHCILKITELLMSIGVSWIGCMGLYRYLIYYEPLINFRYLFGYNAIISGEDGLLAYVNYGLILNVLPIIIFVLFFIATKLKPSLSMTQLTKKFLLIQLTYVWLVFNSVILMFGLFTQSFTQTFNTIISISSLVIGILYLIVLFLMSIFMIKNEESFAYLKSQMNLDRRKGPIFFFIVMVVLKLACIQLYLLLGYYQQFTRKYTPLIFVSLSLVTLSLAILIRPYENNIRVLFNELIQLFVFACYFLIKEIENAEWSGFAIVILLYLQVFINYFSIGVTAKENLWKYEENQDQQNQEEMNEYEYKQQFKDPQNGEIGDFRFIDPKVDPIGTTIKKDQIFNQYQIPDSSIRNKFNLQREIN